MHRCVILWSVVAACRVVEALSRHHCIAIRTHLHTHTHASIDAFGDTLTGADVNANSDQQTDTHALKCTGDDTVCWVQHEYQRSAALDAVSADTSVDPVVSCVLTAEGACTHGQSINLSYIAASGGRQDERNPTNAENVDATTWEGGCVVLSVDDGVHALEIPGKADVNATLQAHTVMYLHEYPVSTSLCALPRTYAAAQITTQAPSDQLGLDTEAGEGDAYMESVAQHTECLAHLSLHSEQQARLAERGIRALRVSTRIPAHCCTHALAARTINNDTAKLTDSRLDSAAIMLVGNVADLVPTPAAESCPPPPPAPPVPWWRSESVMAAGKKGLFLPVRSLPENASNGQPDSSWSLCAWIWWHPTPAQLQGLSPITVFFKGPGGGSQQRTPSAWINPQSRKLMLRISRLPPNEDPDIGAESISPVPMREWTHFCFTMANMTATTAAEGAATYMWRVYMNGRLDSELQVSVPAVIGANDGGLHVGWHQVDFPGLRSLIADVQLHSHALTSDHALAVYAEHAWVFRDDKTHAPPIRSDLRATLKYSSAVAATTLFGTTRRQCREWSATASASCAACKAHDADRLGQPRCSEEVHAQRCALACTLAPAVALCNALPSAGVTDVVEMAEEDKDRLQTAERLLSSCKADATLEEQDHSYAQAVSMLHAGWFNTTSIPAAGRLLGSILINPGRDHCATDLLRHAPSVLHRKDVGRMNALLGVFRTAAHSITESLFGSDDGSGDGHDVLSDKPLPSYLLRLLVHRRRNLRAGCELLLQAGLRGDAAALFRWSQSALHGICPSPHSSSGVSLGLMHMAAMLGSADAWMFLSRWYGALVPSQLSPCQSTPGRSCQQRHVVVQDLDAAGWYLEWAADAAETLYFTPGAQQQYEYPTLTQVADGGDALEAGQRGVDDAVLQFHHDLAARGDVPSLNFLADGYYWGKHGLPRDHIRAAHMWEAAANAGNAAAQVALAGLYIRGEGVAMNHSTAVEWYTQAARQNASAALNGLGYAHVKGLYGVEQNHSLAFSYFERAVAQRDVADSFINAAQCLFGGIGTPVNVSRAFSLLVDAAHHFGHFQAVLEVGRRHAQGSVPRTDVGDGSVDQGTGFSERRDVPTAFAYLSAAARQGHWSALIRRGFDRFLARDFDGALVHFLEAHALGVQAAALNAGMLLYHRLASIEELQRLQGRLHESAASDNSMTQTLLEQALEAGAHEARMPLANAYLRDAAAPPRSVARALELLTMEVNAGNAEAAHKIAEALEAGAPAELPPGAPRDPESWYVRSLELAKEWSGRAPTSLALLRLRIARWYQGFFSLRSLW